MVFLRASCAWIGKPLKLKSQNFLTHSKFARQQRQHLLFSTSSSSSSSPAHSLEDEKTVAKNFIVNIIEEDLRNNKNNGRVLTRFPPEPNGYLHLGHAKSINLNFGVAKAFNGVTNMRFDDTNPEKEDMEYVNAILDDVRWLVTGNTHAEPAPWDGAVRHASDYFQVIYDAAEYLIQNSLAYVDHLTQEEMREYRGSLTEPGKNSPYRDRSVEENLRLFREMRDGLHPDGHCVLRAKIDMAHGNINMRDPALYRIKKASHPVTGDKWCVYPMYDFAHAISDAMESITHSLCTLEFETHRPLYDWTIESLLSSGLLPQKDNINRPRQYEFSRLNIQYTVLSKRKLITLVNQKHVHGWDDPRMPTICGIRRRGMPHTALQLFCQRVGISKAESNIDYSVLEDCCREVLDDKARRIFAVQDPLKVTITNYPEGKVETFSIENHPKHEEMGKRELHFERTLFIDRADFHDGGVNNEIPVPKGYKRLLLGGTVRLKHGYAIQCSEVVRDTTGKVVELLCTFDETSKHGQTPQEIKKPKGIIQWLGQNQAKQMEIRLYDRLFNQAAPGKDHDFLQDLNPHSLSTLSNALIDSNVLSLIDLTSFGQSSEGLKNTFQFERMGYFSLDRDSTQEKLVFNRVVTLKDTWATKQ
eukprot:scaffold6586_cov169-Ochromonas_danica.AAC.3